MKNKFIMSSEIPAVLILAGQKTFGRTKNNTFLYKCIPNDPELAPMLVPYKHKTSEFSKVFSNLYVLVIPEKNNEANADARSMATMSNVIGPVNRLDAFYEYQIVCKKLNIPYTQLTKAINLKKITHSLDPSIFDKAWKKKYDIFENLDKNLSIYTIDPQDCADFDDAFSIDTQTNILTVYIANVPVILDTYDLWSALSLRVATMYMPGFKRPMLPPKLSEGLCSLKAGLDRVAFAMEFCLSDLTYIRHYNCLINVKRNYIYEESDLLSNKDYQFIKQIFQHKLGNRIKDSHDVVAHMMLTMNASSANLLINKQCGIFRTVSSRAEDTGMRAEDTETAHPPEISQYIYNWKYMHGEYIAYDCECDRIFHHATLGLDAYAHITSPIRRLVDVINMSLLSLNSDTHMHMYNEWTQKMPYLNTQMKSIQQVQNTCALLEKITTYPDISRETFTGYIFDSNMVYIPKLRITSKYTKTICSDSKSNETIGNFGVFLFSDEFNVPQKIRICQK